MVKQERKDKNLTGELKTMKIFQALKNPEAFLK